MFEPKEKDIQHAGQRRFQWGNFLSEIDSGDASGAEPRVVSRFNGATSFRKLIELTI
jgi:hypothetical protein